MNLLALERQAVDKVQDSTNDSAASNWAFCSKWIDSGLRKFSLPMGFDMRTGKRESGQNKQSSGNGNAHPMCRYLLAIESGK
jgi:hypothetical protein